MAKPFLYDFSLPAGRLSGDLRNFESKTFSQNGEDGIIQEIFRRLKMEQGVFVEFGAESGRECNCARLAREQEWSGFFIEANLKSFEKLRSRYETRPHVKCAQAWITSSNIETLFSSLGVPREFELLSIDIDGNDYWVWKAINSYHPIVVVIEYNASYPPPARWVMVEKDDHDWDGTTHFGASLASLAVLGEQKGYRLIGTNSNGVNAFFLRSDYFDERLFVAGSVEYHYSRPTYGPFGAGHPYRDGPYLEI